MYWDLLTTLELDALDRSLPVILPMAATEQHGPHLPLATDRMIAEHIVAALDAALPGKLLMLPVVGIGCSRHHMDFAGSLNVSHETFRRQILDILESVSSYGFTRFLLLNAHGGNHAIGGVIVEQFGAANPDCRIAFSSWWQAAREPLMALSTTGPGGVGHACEFETSLMLHFAPHLVRRDLIAARANRPAPEWAEGDMLRGPRASLYRSTRQMTPTGVFGEPTAASAELGKKVTNAVTASFVPVLMDLGSLANDEL